MAAAVGETYGNLMDNITGPGISAFAGGQQSLEDIGNQMNQSVANAGAGLNNLADQAAGGSVTAALALPSVAITAGVGLAIASIGSGLSALDTLVSTSMVTNYSPPAWCSGPSSH